MHPSVSVIIPTWNRAEDTLRAVESVLRQTYQDFEIIVVDDGSTDETEAIFSNYPDKRVSYLRLEHTGLPAAPRNTALRIAKGEWVAFLDSDDTWNPTKLAIQMKYLARNPDVKLVSTNAYRIKNGKRTGLFFLTKSNIKDSLESLFEHGNFIINSSVIILKNLIEKYGSLSEDILKRGIEDFDFWSRICIHEPFHYINIPLVNYADNQKDSVRSQIAEENSNRGMLDIFEKTLDACIGADKLTPKLESLMVKRIFTYRSKLIDWRRLQGEFHGEKQIPKVSVILPVFNGEKFILESVFSILNQTYRELELIIINDGSTDQTKKLLETLSDPRIIIHHQKNQGIVASLNKGIELSRGIYIARQDHDDIAFPTRIERQVNYMKQNPDCGLLGTWAEIWDEKNCTLGTLTPPDSDIVLRERLLFDNPFVHSSIMFRKRLLEKIAGYDPDFAPSALEDYELWSRLSGYCKIANLPETLQVYRSVTGSITQTKRDNFAYRERVAKKYVSQYIKIENCEKNLLQLVALSVYDQKRIDLHLSFISCRIVYNQLVKNLLKSASVDFKGSGLEKNSSIYNLRQIYFTYKVHLPWRAIIKLEKQMGSPLLTLFEHWEGKAPRSFACFTKISSAIYKFFLHFYQGLLNLFKKSKERKV